MKKYVVFKDGEFVRLVDQKPHWYFDGGEEVSDEWLIEKEGMYPLERPYDDNPLYFEKDPNLWIREEDKVIKTYYKVIDPEINVERSILIKITLNPSSQWMYDDITNEVTKTYTIEDRSDEDLENLVKFGKRVVEDMDPNYSYLEKPVSTWLYYNGFIYPKYWKIVKKQIDIRTSIFYNYNARDVSEWDRDDEFIYEQLEYTLKDPYIDTSVGREMRLSILEYSTEYRYMLENSDISYNGSVFKCDKESQQEILSLYIMSKNGIIEGIDWKVEDVEVDGKYHGYLHLTIDDIKYLYFKIFKRFRLLCEVEKSIYEDLGHTVYVKHQKEIFDSIKPRYDKVIEEIGG